VTTGSRESPTSWGTAVTSSTAVASAAASIAVSSVLFITPMCHWPASDSTNCTQRSSSPSDSSREGEDHGHQAGPPDPFEGSIARLRELRLE
jgi:hypothetical protein